MIGKLVSLVVVLLIGWIIYVTAFGTDKDIALRNNLFSTAKNLGQSVGEIFSSEKGKYDAGEYDKALSTISSTIGGLKKDNSSGGKTNATYEERIKNLEAEKKRLDQESAKQKAMPTSATITPEQQKLQDDLKKLAADISALSKEMEKK